MKKAIVVTIAIAFIALWAIAAVLVVRHLSGGSELGRSESDRVQAEIPRDVSACTLAVFNFRPSGDADARLYAVGFARALADKVCCTPTCLTQQVSVRQISQSLASAGQDPGKPPSDEVALSVGESLAVRYVLTGDFQLHGDRVDTTLYLSDTSNAASKSSIRLSGTVSGVPQLQVDAARSLIQTMKLQQSAAHAKELGRPNFTKPEVLKLYGRSFFADSVAECESYRWKAVDLDPGASFPVIRLLEYYLYSPLTCPQIKAEPRLKALLAGIPRRFPGHSQIGVLKGLLFKRQFQYGQAEAELRSVTKNDPEMAAAHTALASVALCRKDARLAVEECLKLTGMWPNNGHFHAMLAKAYREAAGSARQAHYLRDLTPERERRWRGNMEKCRKAALAAVGLDPDCSHGWKQLLAVGRERGTRGDVERACREMIRIDPRNPDAYISWAFSFSPQWGGSDSQQEQIMEEAEKAFGPESAEARMIRASILLCNAPAGTGRVGGKYAGQILRIAGEVEEQSLCLGEPALLLKCRAYMVNRRRADMLTVAEKGFATWGSHVWRYLLGMACAFRYEDEGDLSSLDRAKELFEVYAQEIPFDPRGHIQWGWCLSHQGRPAEARKKFSKALQLDPANKSAKEKLQYVQ